MSPTPVTQKNWIRGLVATAGVMSQPKGSFPRGSNLLLTRRGSLRTVDGSQLLHAFNGAVQSGRGKVMASYLFAPTGVSRYYLAVMKALDQPLGPPKNLLVSTAAGGSLAAATYFYVVTALDGVGGETTISNEVSIATGANGKNTLTWNAVPNAVSYNVYRSLTTGTELILIGSPTAVLPVLQPAFGTLTVSFVDDGTTSGGSFAFSTVTKTLTSGSTYLFTFYLPASGFPPQSQAPNIAGKAFTVAGASPSSFNGAYPSTSFAEGSYLYVTATSSGANASGTGGTITLGSGAPPVADTTQQTALYRMPLIVGDPAALPVSYNNTNIVALFPADFYFDRGGGGGSGGGGSTGGGGATGGGGTPSGGRYGNVSLLPQFVTFTNQVVLALGNGFPPQVYSDPTSTTTNPATTSSISSISVDAFGVVTVTVAGGHGFPVSPVILNAGANAIIAGVTASALYNGTFPLLQVVSATVFKVRNLAAIGAGAGGAVGTVTTTTIPLYSNFTPAIPVWITATPYSLNAVVQPTVGNLHLYKAIQAGTSGAAQPTFPTGTGARVTDGSIIWQEAGLINAQAPAPPGAAHLGVYSGALWAWNTSASNTTTGLDGPCSLRMSDINNLNSWNPINQAFLDKDDGTEGEGLSSFTITAQGIPPQGSLVAFKDFATYQILGIFGAPNFAIQRVKTDMGCTAPRTLQYVPGFGIERMTHLGVGVFDGVDDRVVSEEIRPYLFPSNDLDVSDITVMDAQWYAVSWAAQTASPPMYCIAIPIGTSGGALTRILCYDLVLKAWAAPVDLPFPISSLSQFRTATANPVTVTGGFSDGLLSRWQAGDITWDTGATGARTPSVVQFNVRTPTVAGNDLDQRIYIRRQNIRGINTNSTAGLTVTLILDGVAQPAYKGPALAVGDFETEVGVGFTVLRAESLIAGSGDVELWGCTWGLTPRPQGVPALIT